MPAEVSLREVSVEYPRRDRLGRVQSVVRALDRVNLEIPEGAVMAIAGASGCGKSTLARCLAGWQQPTSGEVVCNVPVQLVMQDPGASLNPRFTAFEIVEEPLRISGRRDASRVRGLLECVGVAGANRLSGEFSGGERARLAIARALAAMPGTGGGLLILDESLSSLDPDTRAGILAFLFEFRRERTLRYLFISHELEWLADIVNDLVILHEGRIMERAAPREILERPRHEFTALLVDCMLTGK